MKRILSRLLLVGGLTLGSLFVTAPGVSATTYCDTQVAYYDWSLSGSGANYYGTFKLTGSGCYNGSSSWGTGISYAWYSGYTTGNISGPSYYNSSPAQTIFWDNRIKTFTPTNGNTLYCDLYPRLNLDRYGTWTRSGTSVNSRTLNGGVPPLCTISGSWTP
jgi:hypothetical protein